MSEPITLDRLRREIDTIDGALHDLIMRRAEVVRTIGQIKASQTVALSPSREAQILRRLTARHQGPLPVAVVVRMWRELLAGTTGMQRPFSIAVVVPDHDRSLWDLARDHFGSTTPITATATPMQAISAVSERSAGIAVVPWPDSEDRQPWWPALRGDDAQVPRVVARLPVTQAHEGGDGPVALALGCLAHEPTGDDVSLLAVELDGAVSRGRLKQVMQANGLAATAFWTAKPVGEQRLVQLVEIDGFVGDDDPRLGALVAGLEGPALSARPIGGFARPIRLNGPATRG